MTCRTVKVGGVTAIVCSRGSKKNYCGCGARATLLCDYPLRGPKAGKTCDIYICASCAREMGPDRHYCPVHAQMEAQP